MVDFDHDPSAAQHMVHGELPRRLAFLGRLKADMTLAIERCDIYLAENARDEPNVAVLTLAAEGAVIAYGRCVEGVGGRFPAAALAALSEEARDLHDWVIDLRNKYVGHSVNAMNQVVTIAEHGGARDMPAVFATSVRVVLDADAVEDIRLLAEAAGALIDSEMSALAGRIVQVLAASEPGCELDGQLQLDLVARDAFDFAATRRPLRGMFQVPFGPRSTPVDEI